MAILSIKQLEKRLGNTIVVPKFDLDIQAGEAIAIQCNNEVGTQLMNMMIGKTSLSNGEILLEDMSLNHNYKKLSSRVGIFLLNDSFYNRLTPREYLKFFKQLYGGNMDIDSLIHRVSLVDKRTSRIDKLTFSEKKRLQLAKVILHQPDLILMEEPDQNIDIESKIIFQKILEDLTKEGKAVLITTNNLESAISITNHVYRLNEEGLKKIEVTDENEKDEIHTLNTDSSEEYGNTRNVSNDDIDTLEVEQDNNAVDEGSFVFNKQIRFEKIPAKINDKIILFDPTEIDFIESNDGISHLHVDGEVFPCSITLSELFDRLRAFGFFRCHRSYIVNLLKVREVITWSKNSYSLILEDSKKSSVPLSKGKLSELKEIIGI